MQSSAANKIAPRQSKIEITEIKKSLPLRKIDEELSEFERARQPAKLGPWDKTDIQVYSLVDLFWLSQRIPVPVGT